MFHKWLNPCITAHLKVSVWTWKCYELKGCLSMSVVMAPAYKYFARMVELSLPPLFPCDETKCVSLWKEQQTGSNCAKCEQSVLSLPLIPNQPYLKCPVWRSRNSVSLTELCVTSNELCSAVLESQPQAISVTNTPRVWGLTLLYVHMCVCAFLLISVGVC